jgi:predicted dehydrogenase
MELVREGAVGDPVMIRASFSYAMGTDRRQARDVRVQPELEGGSLMDVGCYAVNAARYLFGAEPVEVAAQQRVDPALGVDTLFAGTLRFPGDRLAQIDGGFDAAGTQRYELAGAKGLIQVQRAYLPGDAPGQIHVVTGGERRVLESAAADQYALEADHMARSIRAGRLLEPAEDGTKQAAVIEALYESAATGRAVRL